MKFAAPHSKHAFQLLCYFFYQNFAMKMMVCFNIYFPFTIWHACIHFLFDLVVSMLQVFAYAMMSAGSAASGVGNLNRTGIRHTPLPNFCKPLHMFCDRIAISIAFTFFSFLLLATSAVQNVIWLSNNC